MTILNHYISLAGQKIFVVPLIFSPSVTFPLLCFLVVYQLTAGVQYKAKSVKVIPHQ